MPELLEPLEEDEIDAVDAVAVRDLLRREFGGPVPVAEAPRPLTLPQGIPTGYPDLDALLGGLKPGQVVAFAGDPGCGASTLALNLVRKALRDGVHAAIYAPQQSRQVFARRALCAEARVEPHGAAEPARREADRERLAAARERLAVATGEPLILDRYGATVAELRRALSPRKAGGRVDLLLVDAVESLAEPSLLRAMEGLRELAVALKIPVVVFCRLDERRRGSRAPVPTVAEAPPPVALLSDAVVLLHRPERDGGDKGPELVTAEVAYQRQGPRGVAPLAFRPRCARFDSVRWDM